MENTTEYFISINDVSKRLSIPAYTLRYWEKQFPTAIKPTTGAGGRRYYRAETVDKIVIIKDLLYKKGMTIAGVKKMLHNGSFTQELGKQIEVENNKIDTSNGSELETVLNMLYEARSVLKNS